MNYMALILVVSTLFFGCTKQPSTQIENMPQTYVLESEFAKLPNWEKENYDDVLESFINNCQTKKTKKIYNSLCEEAKSVSDPKLFLESYFAPYKIYTDKSDETGLLTGYYEPELRGSLTKDDLYKYPVYKTPDDLVVVDLGSIYPDLKNYRLRGKLEGNRVVPYHKRKEQSNVKSEVICYVDSKIDLFFLEIQGSGRVTLKDGSTLFIGYANQNGHKYRAIGRYLVQIGALKIEEVSLQSIRAWLDQNPSRVDEVLNYNDSLVFFQERKQAASGSLGLELTAKRSVAVDRRYIPLGSMLYLNSNVDEKQISKVVMAQDTGGAIKGAVRADLFLGFGEDAMQSAGRLKSPLELWVLVPKKSKGEI